MGYTTEFEGAISVEPPLNEIEVSFLRDLAKTRRMSRGNGPLFVNYAGQGADADVRDYNTPHPSQPGLWLQWVASADGTKIGWGGGEKFYNAPEWMKYLIEKLFSAEAEGYVLRWGPVAGDVRLAGFTFNHVFNGEIMAYGEEPGDVWKLVVRDNKVEVER